MKTVDEILAEIDRQINTVKSGSASVYQITNELNTIDVLTKLKDWITKREPRIWIVYVEDNKLYSPSAPYSSKAVCVKVREVLDDVVKR